MFTKNKIINHLTKKGKRAKSEKIFNKSIKELQKNSKKNVKNLIKLSIILSSLIFKIRTIKNKKNKKKQIKTLPTFIDKKNKRNFFAVKLIVSAAKENPNHHFHNKLKEEIFSAVRSENNTIKSQKYLEKQTLKKKYLFKYYRWT